MKKIQELAQVQKYERTSSGQTQHGVEEVIKQEASIK